MTAIGTSGGLKQQRVPLVAACALLFALFPLPAWAQGSPATPSTVLPGTVEGQFQTPPQPRAQPQPIQLPRVQQRVPANADALRFGVQRIVLEGAQALPMEQLRARIAPLEGRELSLADLISLANALTATYRNEGFILAQVLVPEQRIESTDAVVRLQVIEGFVDAVRFSGELGQDSARLDAVAAAISAARPLTAQVLERYLLLLNDIPGLRAATTLTPSPTQLGAADLEIRVSRRSLAGEVAIDNRGSRAVGSWRVTADVEALGLTGASRTAAKLVSSGDSQLQFGQLQHEQVLSHEGTRLLVTAGAARSHPSLPAALGATTLETDSRSFSLAVQHPLIRSRAHNLYLRGALTAYHGQTRTNATLTGEDRIRAVRLGLTWDLADAYQGLNVVDLELAQGLSGWGASAADNPNRSRAAGRTDFSKINLYAARLQSVARRWSVLLALNAQLAFTDLLAPELFGVGGEPFGRGYDPSELLGDHGAALKLELRYTGNTDLAWVPNYTLYGFYDAGVVRRRTPVSESAQASLTSAGLGLRFGTGRRLSGFVEVAQPLTRPVATRGDRDARSHAGVAAKF
jgi:hemolysin activation/secretion protein